MLIGVFNPDLVKKLHEPVQQNAVFGSLFRVKAIIFLHLTQNRRRLIFRQIGLFFAEHNDFVDGKGGEDIFTACLHRQESIAVKRLLLKALRAVIGRSCPPGIAV